MAAVQEMYQWCTQGSVSSPDVHDQILHKEEPAGKCKAATFTADSPYACHHLLVTRTPNT